MYYLRDQRRLVNLWDMLIEFDAETFVRMISTLQLAEQAHSGSEPNELVSPSYKEVDSRTFKAALEACQKLGIPLTCKHVERSLDDLQAPDVKFGDVTKMYEELRNRLADELSQKLFFHIAPQTAKYYTELQPFGQQVADQFPSLIDDIEEAAKC